MTLFCVWESQLGVLVYKYSISQMKNTIFLKYTWALLFRQKDYTVKRQDGMFLSVRKALDFLLL